jgi:glycerophosphoryl diester phosphodiesterase
VPSWLTAVPLAHRGLHGDGVPENSLPAFAAAAAAGYGIELDVMLTGDGIPVVVHDLNLGRLTGQQAAVSRLPLAALRELRLGESDERIPTLCEALEVVGDAPVMVEVKQPRVRAGRLEAGVAEVLVEHGGPTAVAGFNPATLRWFRRFQPLTPRVLTAGVLADVRLPVMVKRRLAALRDLPAVDPQAVSYELEGLPTPPATRWREGGGVLVTWTVTDEASLARARELADNIIFEHVRP